MTATLAKDILSVLGGRLAPSSLVGDPEVWAAAAVNMARHTSGTLKARRETGAERLKEKILWASELGERCHRKLWYKFHMPQVAEPLSGATQFKFAFGNIIEEMALVYAKAAGYKVNDQQSLLTEQLGNGWLVRGRIDAALTSPTGRGFILDSKSCSSNSFQMYSRAPVLTSALDSFGYIQQLYFYDNNKEQLASFPGLDGSWQQAEYLFIDKQLGRMHSMTYSYKDAHSIDHSYQYTKGGSVFDSDMVAETPPRRGHLDHPEGASGNMRLGTACSYCPFKATCWPGLRAFKYSTGPKFLTQVVKDPHVPEIPLTGEEG